MGQTVSLNACVSGGSFVRVMKSDGDFEEFEFPCVAAEVMLQHPGHIVVHCTPVNQNTIGQQTKITIMLPDQPMLAGQPYMLYPIPDHYKKSLARSKSFSILKKKFEQSSTPTITPSERRQGRRKALKMLLTRLNLATYVASTLKEEKDEEQPQQETAEEEEMKDEMKDEKQGMIVQLPRPQDLNYGWRPFLMTIPESPLGFHSAPQTPAGLYKMDRAIPASPLSMGKRPAPTFGIVSS